MNKWIKRWEKVLDDFQKLKNMTKQYPAGLWSPEYRELAEKIHAMGREHFHVGTIVELLNEQERAKNGETPIEEAYRAMTKIQAMFPHCPWCSRAFPGHCQDTCAVVKVYDAVRAERGE